jgi:hypothetical protein
VKNGLRKINFDFRSFTDTWSWPEVYLKKERPRCPLFSSAEMSKLYVFNLGMKMQGGIK